MKDKTAIVGIGQTIFEKRSEDTELILACKAIKDALGDAGIEPGEVDSLCNFKGIALSLDHQTLVKQAFFCPLFSIHSLFLSNYLDILPKYPSVHFD